MDGTLSLVGYYTRKNDIGKHPAVVVSKRPLDPNEPPMVPASLPIKIQKLRGSASAAPRVDNADSGTEDVPERAELQGAWDQPKMITSSLEDMWEYIRPYLLVHKSPPTTNWVHHVALLPRVRDIKWNEERNKDHPYRDSKPRDITALIVQVTGVDAPAPCDSCAQGKGPFVGCVKISPQASAEAKASVLSCANCEARDSSMTMHRGKADYCDQATTMVVKPSAIS